MKETNRIIIPTRTGWPVRSLCWLDDQLVDWVDGGTRYNLDGTISESKVNWAYKFDRAVMSRDAVYAVIYEQLGTKGLVIKQGRIIREINRSFYCADVYEYPVTIFELPDKRTALAHCPDEYNKIEIEDIETGERLTSRETKPQDFFQSRLQVSADGRFLMSAGWIWHPLDALNIFDVRSVLDDPGMLDKEWNIDLGKGLWEIHCATFRDNHSIAFTLETADERTHIVVFNLMENRTLSQSPLEEIAGTLMPVEHYVVGFYDHPKLIEVETGKVINRWADLNTGKQNSSIIGNLETLPPLALDTKNKRFAVADTESITIVQLG